MTGTPAALPRLNPWERLRVRCGAAQHLRYCIVEHGDGTFSPYDLLRHMWLRAPERHFHADWVKCRMLAGRSCFQSRDDAARELARITRPKRKEPASAPSFKRVIRVTIEDVRS